MIDEASIKEKLWHSMREDLAQYLPAGSQGNTLMCPACGRFLPFEDFSLEHIIPNQALAHDPAGARAVLTANERSGNILLCNNMLRVRDRVASGNGCNGWKGRYYDKPLREVFTGKAASGRTNQTHELHLVALLCAAYLAMVSKFGYQIAVTPSGVLMRQQFFVPIKFHRDMPLSCQMILGADLPEFSRQYLHLWSDPFKISIHNRSAIVLFRTLAIRVPLTRDPTVPVAKKLRVAPQKYKLRPDFRTVFE